jgi:hypothetical protein
MRNIQQYSSHRNPRLHSDEYMGKVKVKSAKYCYNVENNTEETETIGKQFFFSLTEVLAAHFKDSSFLYETN